MSGNCNVSNPHYHGNVQLQANIHSSHICAKCALRAIYYYNKRTSARSDNFPGETGTGSIKPSVYTPQHRRRRVNNIARHTHTQTHRPPQSVSRRSELDWGAVRTLWLMGWESCGTGLWLWRQCACVRLCALEPNVFPIFLCLQNARTRNCAQCEHVHK